MGEAPVTLPDIPSPATTPTPPATAEEKATEPGSAQPIASTSSSLPTVTTGPGLGTALCGRDAADEVIVSRDLVVQRWNGKVSIDGVVALCAYVAGYQISNYDHISQGTIDINLGRRHKTVEARVGITDDSYADQPVEVKILADGNLVYERTFVLGQSEDVVLDVTGVLRLSFVFTGQLTRANAAVGDPRAFE